jgi:hypothetical protein
MLIIRRLNCIDAASGIVTLSKWSSGAHVERELLCSTCFEHYMLIIRRLNCIDAASGIVTLSKWLSGAQVERESSFLSTCAPDSHLLRVTIPDAASIQFNLLMMSIKRSKHVENHNKRVVK